MKRIYIFKSNGCIKMNYSIKKFYKRLGSIVIKFILMIFLLFIGINIIYSQKYAKNQFVVFSYKVDIDERVKKELNPYSDKIKYDLNKKHSKVEGMLVHSIYSIITKTLSDSLDIYFLTPNCFGDKIKYNDFGYPEIVIQKAIRLMDAKYFMKIDASIENSKFDEKGKKISEGLFLPVVNISIEIYNKFGFDPIQTGEGQAVASSPVVMSTTYIAGLNFVDGSIKPLSKEETLKNLIERCSQNVVYSIKYRKLK